MPELFETWKAYREKSSSEAHTGRIHVQYFNLQYTVGMQTGNLRR
jgi:hypothetical protein